MSWLRLDDGFTKHPKFAGWTVGQKWALLELLEYCARYQTAGRVPTDTSLLPRSITAGLLRRAESAGFLDRDRTGALIVHDWEVYNPARNGVDEAVSEYLTAHPEASANEVVQNVKGNRKRLLKAVSRFRSGSTAGSETGSESVPDRYQSGYARARAGAPAFPSRPLPNKEPEPGPEPDLHTQEPPGTGPGHGTGNKPDTPHDDLPGRLDPRAALRDLLTEGGTA